MYHPLDYRGLLEFGTRIYNFIFLCKNQLIFEKIIRQFKEAEFYNIKARLNLGHFSVKTFLLSSFALAAITFQKFDHVVKTFKIINSLSHGKLRKLSFIT